MNIFVNALFIAFTHTPLTSEVEVTQFLSHAMHHHHMHSMHAWDHHRTGGFWTAMLARHAIELWGRSLWYVLFLYYAPYAFLFLWSIYLWWSYRVGALWTFFLKYPRGLTYCPSYHSACTTIPRTVLGRGDGRGAGFVGAWPRECSAAPTHHPISSFSRSLIWPLNPVISYSPKQKTILRWFFVFYYLPFVLRTCVTASLARPLRRRRKITLRPPGVAVRARNPWVRFRFVRLGLYVVDICFIKTLVVFFLCVIECIARRITCQKTEYQIPYISTYSQEEILVNEHFQHLIHRLSVDSYSFPQGIWLVYSILFEHISRFLNSHFTYAWCIYYLGISLRASRERSFKGKH